MQDKQTLFDYLYKTLHEQIENGRFPYGSKLPSRSHLCETYNVGMRTVKDVLMRLKIEGYIQTQERKPTIVIYDSLHTHKDFEVQYVLEHKSSIVAVYETLASLMPKIFALSIQNCSDDFLKHWQKRLNRAKNNNDIGARKQINIRFLHDILTQSNNQLFKSLFFSLELYTYSSFFLELLRTYPQFPDIFWVSDALLNKNDNEIKSRFQKIYSSFAETVEKYLIQLSSRYPNIHEKQFSYTWTVEVGRDHYYTQIVRDLIDKVGLGFYKKNEFLPSEAQLAKQYKVSISTIKKSLSVLNELGYGETINGKGTKIYIQNDQYTIKSLNNKKYRKDTIIYLNALQLMVLNIEVAAFLAFEEIDARTIANLKTKIQNSQNIILDELFHCILEHVQLKPLKTVLQENNKVLYWGYYLSFYHDESQIIQELNSKAMVAFEYLSSGNQKDFAKEMSKCYRDVFHIVKKHMISFGLYEVKRLIAPR